MALVVYGSSLSPFVRKVRIFLAEKGLDYQLEQVNPFSPPPGFIDISPLKRIPAFRDTDLPEPNTLSDSSIICDYLEHKFAEPALYPKDFYLRARALWFEEYADSVMAQHLGGGVFFERIVKKLIGQKTDEAAVATTLATKVPPLFDYLEKQIGENEFIVGNKFSIADISLGTMLVNFCHGGECVDGKLWPKLGGYMDRLHARASFKERIAEEAPFIAQMRAA
ncbi:MAG TPA: glutathione S-transferase family protein [Rhizomicrobium sp.]|jgi:glutathione S-transferase